LQLGAHFALLVHAILYMIPLWGIEFQSACFVRALQTSLFISIFNLIKTHGRPQFTKEYGIRIVQDEQAHGIMYAGIFMSAKPFFSTCRVSRFVASRLSSVQFSSVRLIYLCHGLVCTVALVPCFIRSALVLGKYMRKTLPHSLPAANRYVSYGTRTV
jgi:hypothetical protein